METEDLGMAMVDFKNGAVGTVLGTTTFPVNVYHGIEIHGDRGGVIAMDEAKWFFRNPEDREKLSRPDAHANVIEDVNAAVRQGTLPLCTGEEGLRSVRFLEAIYRSSQEGKPVDL